MSIVPVCMIIDDPAPFFNAGTVLHPEDINETPTEFYMEFGKWAKGNGVKGKFSVVPVCGSVAAIDGSLGEYPGHTSQERVEWTEMIKSLYMPNWTITPEIITHKQPWNIKNHQLLDIASMRENEYFASLDVVGKTEYIIYAMQMLKNAGITAGGCTMCWSMPVEQNLDFAKAVLEAVREVYGPSDVMIFNDSFVKSELVYITDDNYAAVKISPVIGDIDGIHYASENPSKERIQCDTDKFISEDGKTGAFVDIINSGNPLIFLTHIQSLHTNGLKSGFEVYKITVDRLNRFYGDRIEWMKTEELVCKIANEYRLKSTE